MISGEILMLAHRIPFPPDRGDKIRSHHILKKLVRMAPVHVACFADTDADLAEEVELAAVAHSYRLIRRAKSLFTAGAQALLMHRPVSLTAFHDPGLADYVKRLLATGRVRTIYVFSGQMAQYVPADFTGRLVIDFVDVDSAKFEAYAARHRGPMGWLYAREARLLSAEEQRQAARADAVLLVSHAEADLFASRMPPGAATQVRVLGNGVDADAYDPAQQFAATPMAGHGAPRLIFTGQMDYPPNIEAAMRMARRIMPLVRAQCPEASFHVVGRQAGEKVLALDGLHGTKVWGEVADIRPWLRAADMAVVPLDIARGVQNKVLEAMAMGLPVVASHAAATGINAIAGHHFMVADNDTAIAAAVVSLARDPHLMFRMGQEGRRFVIEHQGWQRVLAPLAGLLSSAPPPPREPRAGA